MSGFEDLFSRNYDASGIYGRYGVPVPPGESTDPTNRYCISVIDESNNFTTAAIDNKWTAFRSAWPQRKFFLLNPTEYYSPGPVYETNYAGPSGGYVKATYGNLWIPGDAFTDDKFSFQPVTRQIYGPPHSDWAALTGVDLLPAGAKVGLFVDNSGSMTTADVQSSYNAFLAYCAANSIDIITVTDTNEDWITPFVGMAG